MTDTTVTWAIFQYDPKLKESRLVRAYASADHACSDALAMSNADTQPTVEPFEIYNAPLFGGDGEPALEEAAIDFDTPIHVAGEVR